MRHFFFLLSFFVFRKVKWNDQWMWCQMNSVFTRNKAWKHVKMKTIAGHENFTYNLKTINSIELSKQTTNENEVKQNHMKIMQEKDKVKKNSMKNRDPFHLKPIEISLFHFRFYFRELCDSIYNRQNYSPWQKTKQKCRRRRQLLGSISWRKKNRGNCFKVIFVFLLVFYFTFLISLMPNKMACFAVGFDYPFTLSWPTTGKSSN